MKRSYSSASIAVVLLAITLGCTFGSIAIQPAGAPPTAVPEVIQPTFTSQPTAVVETPTPLPSPTSEPTAVPTKVLVPQQWNGTYTYPTGATQALTLLIEKMDGTKFTGKMIWQAFGNSKGATLKMNGEFISDIGNDVEIARWNNLEDYKSGEKGGSWLKWTETQVISGRNYTVNGWYYAHIREDGSMVAVYFFNDTELTADVGAFVFNKVR